MRENAKKAPFVAPERATAAPFYPAAKELIKIMQQTETYKLNKPEMSDLMSLAPLNENMDKVEGALTALTARTVTLENLRIMVGRYVGGGNNTGTLINLGARPVAVAAFGPIVYQSKVAMAVFDTDVMGEHVHEILTLTDEGFIVKEMMNNARQYSFIAFFGDWPTADIPKPAEE